MNIIADIMQILLIIISLAIVLSKSNINIVIFISVFSLLTSSLYFLNKAPDVALAEVAIGSAIMPLVYILSISKQREFIVISHIDNDVYLYSGKGYQLLRKFTNYYNLKLYIFNNKTTDELSGIFRKSNIDLIVEKDPQTNKFFLIGKRSSILMNKLEEMVSDDPSTLVIKIKEGETRD